MYRTIVADPPWAVVGAGPCGPFGSRFDGAQDRSLESRPMPYATLSDAAICAMPVSDLALPDAHLYLWATNGKVEAAYAVARAWGFHPSTLLVWAKNPMGGGLGGAFGISTEFVIFARRGKLKTNARIGRTWFNWKRPYSESGKPKHSAKPAELQAMVETVSPGPYLELFARRPRAGWSVWGNEVASDVAMTVV